jgi:hypothetical protein
MGKTIVALLLILSMAIPGYSASRLPAVSGTAPAALSREEQIQVLLFQRLLDIPSREEAVTKDGKPIYLAISADLRGPGVEPRDPSDAVIATLGPRPLWRQVPGIISAPRRPTRPRGGSAGKTASGKSRACRAAGNPEQESLSE